MAKNYQQGVSLIITFFIMVIILSVVLSLSVILFSEIKVIRNISNSVSAFYLADTGVEKTLYYDRKVIPAGAARGICNICSLNVCPGCECSTLEGIDCDTCTNCHIVFTSYIGSDYYRVNANVLQDCRLSRGTANSYGVYKNVSRAVQLDIAAIVSNPSAPNIANALAIFKSQGPSGGKITVSADITDPEGDLQSVTAYVYIKDTEILVTSFALQAGTGGHYSHPWTGAQQGAEYSIAIVAVDAGGNCSSIDNVAVTPE